MVALAQRLKKQLPAFAPSGHFEGSRKMQYLKKYQALIVLDIDNLEEGLEACKNKVEQIPFTLCCFTSPSGRGLKILVTADFSDNTILTQDPLEIFNC